MTSLLVFNRVYRLEIQSVMLRPTFVDYCPSNFSLVRRGSAWDLYIFIDARRPAFFRVFLVQYLLYIYMDSHGCTFPDSEHIEYIRIK
jgi:hypothetical protein